MSPFLSDTGEPYVPADCEPSDLVSGLSELREPLNHQSQAPTRLGPKPPGAFGLPTLIVICEVLIRIDSILSSFENRGCFEGPKPKSPDWRNVGRPRRLHISTIRGAVYVFMIVNLDIFG